MILNHAKRFFLTESLQSLIWTLSRCRKLVGWNREVFARKVIHFSGKVERMCRCMVLVLPSRMRC